MVANGRRIPLAKGAALITTDQKVENIYVALVGTLTVHVPSFGLVATLYSRDILGEMSSLEEKPSSVDVKAAEASQLFAITQDQIRLRFRQEPAFSGRFYRAIALLLSMRLRSTGAKLSYGKAEVRPPGPAENELDLALLQRAHLGGQRFDRMLRQLEMTGKSG